MDTSQNQSNSPRKRAFSYLRFSNIEQLKGDSQRRQLDASRQWCKENEVELVEEMQDHGISAFRGKNRMLGVLGKFLELVRMDKIDKHSILIVENIDRLSREKVLEALTLYMELIKSDISIVTLIDGQTHSRESIEKNPFLLQMAIASMARANDESETKSRRINSVWAESRKNALDGKPSKMGRLPCWMKRETETREIVLLPKQTKILQSLFQMSADGMTPFGITKKLNEEMHPPFTTRGKRNVWAISTVRKLLRAKSACGTLELNEPYKDENGKRKYRLAGTLEDYYPSAISKELFAKVQTILNARAKGSLHKTGGSKASPRNAFSGIAREMVSGGGVRYNCSTYKGRRNEYLRAERFHKQGMSKPSFSWNYMDFQDIFLATCRLALKATSQVTEEEQRLSLIENKISEASDSMDSLMDLAKQAGSSKVALLTELDSMAAQKEELEKEAEMLKDAIRTAKKAKGSIPKRIDDRVKLRAILRANVRSIEIDFDHKLFSCELYSGVKYQAWIDEENRLFVKTNDFDIPEDAFQGVKIRQGWGRRNRRTLLS